jgi:hypothetical protein
MKYISFISLVLLFLSCNNNNYYNYCQSTIEKSLGIRVEDDFTVVESDSYFAIGDYNERFKLKLSAKDFHTAIKSVDSKELKKAQAMELYYYNINNNDGELISFIFDPQKHTIQYSRNSE